MQYLWQMNSELSETWADHLAVSHMVWPTWVDHWVTQDDHWMTQDDPWMTQDDPRMTPG